MDDTKYINTIDGTCGIVFSKHFWQNCGQADEEFPHLNAVTCNVCIFIQTEYSSLIYRNELFSSRCLVIAYTTETMLRKRARERESNKAGASILVLCPKALRAGYTHACVEFISRYMKTLLNTQIHRV